jgi:hypothetical protein
MATLVTLLLLLARNKVAAIDPMLLWASQPYVTYRHLNSSCHQSSTLQQY